MMDLLQQVRDLQYSDKSSAEALLLSFVRKELNIAAASVELRPSAISLNSFNGYLHLQDGTIRFFKSHTETDTVISEYYNSQLLADAGYPVIRPIFQSTEAGKQFLLYELIQDKSVFDLAWEIENAADQSMDDLRMAQNSADQELFRIYSETFQATTHAHPQAPIHQLFSHRLEQGRLERFYGPDTTIALPGQVIDMTRLRTMRWRINGREYSNSLNDIITRSIQLLDPHQAGPSIIGHGDAHNGNVFYSASGKLTYFDPAFAGRHDPLLDLAKPIFHNVFAMWMYFPGEIQRRISVSMHMKDDLLIVDYDYLLPDVRQMFLASKIEHTLRPLLRMLQRNKSLRADWMNFLKSALFCCPLLTMNLCDTDRFPPEISLLGLAMAIEMGAWSNSRSSRIDTVLADLGSNL